MFWYRSNSKRQQPSCIGMEGDAKGKSVSTEASASQRDKRTKGPPDVRKATNVVKRQPAFRASQQRWVGTEGLATYVIMALRVPPFHAAEEATLKGFCAVILGVNSFKCQTSAPPSTRSSCC